MRRMTKAEEEQSRPQSLFDRDGAERGGTTQQAADGGEETAKEDSGGPWRRWRRRAGART